MNPKEVHHRPDDPEMDPHPRSDLIDGKVAGVAATGDPRPHPDEEGYEVDQAVGEGGFAPSKSDAKAGGALRGTEDGADSDGTPSFWGGAEL